MCRVERTLLRRPLRGQVLGLLVAVAAWLLASGMADASCGDWLDGHRPADRLGSVADQLVAPAEGDPGELPRSVAPGTPRCHGPACRGIPWMPEMPRESSADLPGQDPADCMRPAGLLPIDADEPCATPLDRKPVAVVAAVPIRPPRRTSRQA